MLSSFLCMKNYVVFFYFLQLISKILFHIIKHFEIQRNYRKICINVLIEYLGFMHYFLKNCKDLNADQMSATHTSSAFFCMIEIKTGHALYDQIKSLRLNLCVSNQRFMMGPSDRQNHLPCSFEFVEFFKITAVAKF